MVEINDDSRGTYNTNSQIKFKTSKLRSNLYAYVLDKGTISIAAQAEKNRNNGNKEEVFKSCAPFIDCISEIDITQIDNAKHIDVITPMYNLIEYSDNCSKTSESLWQYYDQL